MYSLSLEEVTVTQSIELHWYKSLVMTCFHHISPFDRAVNDAVKRGSRETILLIQSAVSWSTEVTAMRRP